MTTYAKRAAFGTAAVKISEPPAALRDKKDVFSKSPLPSELKKKAPLSKPIVISRTKGGATTNAPEALGAERINISDPSALGNAPSWWKPDIYAQSFVPQAFTAINQCLATPITVPFTDGMNFEKYVRTFYGSSFCDPLPILTASDLERSKGVASLEKLSSHNYEDHFQHALASDLKAQTSQYRSFDLFGAILGCQEAAGILYTLSVNGLRENSPSVSYGDTIMLRQWVPDLAVPLYLGAFGWLPSGPDFPGFTGYEIRAVAVGIDKMTETVHIRAPGLISMPQFKCNVMFTKQTRIVQSLQLAVRDVSTQLQQGAMTNEINMANHEAASTSAEVGSIGSRLQDGQRFPSKPSWLQHMLFPKQAYGILQKGLPSADFPQKWFDTALNYEQKKGIDAVTTTNYGQLCYLINGPPGTGKTKTICEIVTQLGKHPKMPGSVLLCAPSNQAADTLAQRLSKHFRPPEMLRLNHFSRTFAEVPIDLMLYCFVEGNIFNIPPIASLMAYKIVISTCQDADILVQARVSNRDLFKLQHSITTTLFPRHEDALPSTPLHWSALIIDEAAQATEPDTLIPLSLVTPPSNIPQATVQPIFVMAGDHHQLGPRTYDKSTNLHVSLFERLSNEPVYASHPLARKSMRSNTTKHNGPMLRPPFTNLIRNYRSHPAILAVPSSLFYSNTLIPEATSTSILPNWPSWSASSHGWPVQFRCNGGIDECESIRDATHGWFNRTEANSAIACAQDMLFHAQGTTLSQKDIILTSPFNAQVRLLRRLARARNLHALNIGPLEAFQGLESPLVILCTTRARTRFLPEDRRRDVGLVGQKRRFNVALTRAKGGVVVLGNPWVLTSSVTTSAGEEGTEEEEEEGGGDGCWLPFLKFCWRNGLWLPDPVPSGMHPGMEGLKEGRVNEWVPPPPPPAEDGVGEEGIGMVEPSGLEAALLFKEKAEKEQWRGSSAAKRFLGAREDEAWWSGVEAEGVVRGLEEMGLGEGEGDEGGEWDGDEG